MKKVTLIIGGSRGIGKSIYNLLKKRGDKIFCITRKKNKNKDYIEADIANEQDKIKIRKFFKNKKVNNVIFSQRYRGKESEQEFNVMVKATDNIIRLLNYKSKNCSIVIIGSIASTTIIGDQNQIYHYTRGALDILTKYYAFKLGKKNIRVNCVQPTKILKPENKKYFLKKNNSERKLMEKITPLKRMGTSDDVAQAVEFLTSDKSSYITGLIIPIDGGLRLAGQEQIAKMFI